MDGRLDSHTATVNRFFFLLSQLDINAPFEANLSITAFNGATKINRPKLQLGSVVLCRVSWTGCLDPSVMQVATTKRKVGKSFHPSASSVNATSSCFHALELNDSCDVTCEVPNDPRNWSSNEVYLGELGRPNSNNHDGVSAGYFFDVPISHAIRYILACYILVIPICHRIIHDPFCPIFFLKSSR